MKKFDIKEMIKEELKEATKDWSKANLSDQELSMVVALYNQYSGEQKKTADDLQSINIESAKMYFDEYINDVGASPVGKKAAKKILTKLWKIDEQMLGEGTNYTSDSVREFIAKNDTRSVYKPRIKLFGDNFDTKYLDIDWQVLEELIGILEK